MNRKSRFAGLRALLVLGAACISLFGMQARATTADISSIPLGTRSATNVAPNLMFILDDSGSMASDFMPDNANDAICKSCSGTSCSMTGAACSSSTTNGSGLPVSTWGEPPFFASQFNTIYYNPNLVYKPGVDYLNVSLGNQTPTAARNYPYTTTDTTTRDLVTTYGDVYWCTINNPSAADLANSAICQRNGVNTANPFAYSLTTGLPTTTFRNRVLANGSPHYYTVTPKEYCTDETLITCTLSTTATTIGTVSYNFPAPMRWCRSAAAANSTTAVSGNNVSGTGARDCQALIDATYRFPRHGDYVRKDIVPATATYPRATTRTDCAGTVGPSGCSYAEELQNFANWYSYYRSRILMMKTVPGRVFGSIGNDPTAGDIRVGFVTINLNSSAEYLKIDNFKTNTHRQNWFTKLYSITPGNSTPLREALSRVGRHFAGITSGINTLMPDDPMIASCQRNYALLTTDGYWNGNAGQNLAYTGTGSTTGSIGDQDDVPSASPPTYVDRASTVTLDGVGTLTSTSTPVTTLEQAICSGTGNATFSGPTTTPCGCTGSNKRVMQRTRVVTTVVTATDGVPTSTVPTTVDTYQPAPGAEGICTLPAIATTTTPVTDTEQVICTGSATVTFSANGTAPTTTPCGCAAGLKRVMQRTISRVNTLIVNDGVITSNTTTSGTTAFAPASGAAGTCTLPLIVTTVTPVSDKEHVKCVGAGTATFSDGSTTPCGCAAGQAAIKQRVKDRTVTVITNDGVVTSTTTANANTFSNFIGCTNQLVATAVTPITDTEQVKCSGNNTVTFSANGTATTTTTCGCTAPQTRIKQRTVARTSTTITTDGVITSGPTVTTGTPAGTSFQDITACTTPLIVTTVTPISDKEHVKCVGASTATFSDGSTTPCGCSAGQAAIKQRIKDRTLTVITTDGVVTSSSSANTNAFSNFVGCTTQLVSTTVTHTRIIEQQVLTGPVASTFAPVNATAYTNTVSSCVANQARVRTRQTDYDTTVVTTDGVAGAPTLSTTTYSTGDASCVNLTTTVVQPLTETVSVVFPRASPGPGNTTFVASVNTLTNPQTTYTCTTLSATILGTRTMNYSRTTTTVGAGAPTVTYGAATTGFVFGACNTTAKTPVAVAVVNNGSATTTTTGAPTAAATSTTNTPTTTTNGGTNLAVTLSPNPTNNITLANVVTNNGGANLAITLTPNPNNGVNGTVATTNNGGSNLTIALTPNPTNNITGATTATNNGGTTLAVTVTPNPSNGVSGVPVIVSNGGTTITIALSPNPSTGVIGTATTTSTAGGTPNTLADVAMYYYKTDLRTTGPFARDNVPVSGKYIAPHQHMITFTMGLGLDGLMTYRDDYETATTGDFFKIKTGVNTCIWTTGTCNWPVPVGDTPTAIDDLWHAAVNGRGKYFSAKAPIAAENGVKETLAAVNIATGSAAAAATSTPNLTTTNNSLYRSTYRTVKWDGEVVALSIDPATAVVNLTPNWSAATQLNAQGGAASDTRTIYTFDGATASKLKSFTAATLTASELADFQNKCTVANWSQCSYLTSDATRLAAANDGINLINYLRGQRGNELSTDTSTGYFRARDFLLGDTVSAKPAFMGAPELQYGDAGYATFAAANANRTKLLFVGANDGMMHALNASTGAEAWAYVPKMLLPNLYRLANASYSDNHTYYVDGSPTLTDVFIGGAWKTVLVGGLNSGGRGYYALDVTDPSSPKALWEICSDPALCAISDSDMGLTFGQPVIGKRPSDGKWVVLVTSGYNNIGPGNGGGYLYMLDMATGAVLEKVGTTVSGTNVGNSTTPNGFAKIAGFVTNAIVDNTVTLVYGGDLLGNMWRFDLSTSPPTVQRIAQLKDGGGKPQSVTTRPEITRFDAGFNVLYVGTGRFMGATDVPDPATIPLPFAYQQTIYAFKDTNADLGNLRSANLVQQSLTIVDAATRSISNNAVNWTTKNGWYVDLNPVCVTVGCDPAGDSPGERVNIDMQLVRGTLVAITNEPNADQCTAGGDSFLYQFNYSTGSYVPGTPGGVVGTKIGNTLAVGIVIVQPTTGQLTGIITTADGGLPERSVGSTTGGSAPKRAAWRELLDTRTNVNDAP